MAKGWPADNITSSSIKDHNEAKNDNRTQGPQLFISVTDGPMKSLGDMLWAFQTRLSVAAARSLAGYRPAHVTTYVPVNAFAGPIRRLRDSGCQHIYRPGNFYPLTARIKPSGRRGAGIELSDGHHVYSFRVTPPGERNALIDGFERNSRSHI